MKSYAQSTVLHAQKRVLRMVFGYLSKLRPKDLETLYTDGKGLMTLGEVLKHVEAAMNLRVKR